MELSFAFYDRNNYPKSKMAAATITANYEICHNLKSIQIRDPIFVLDPCFQEQGIQ